jgi:hypothetical protein
MLNETQEPIKPVLFEGVDPDLIIKNLLLLTKEEIKNKKLFWKYKNWDKLNVDQKSKTVTFWQDNIEQATRNTILDKIRSSIANDVAVENEKRKLTTKHD